MNNRPKTPHGFARLIIGDGSAVSEQKNIIWNMIGSFLYAFASMVLSIAVVQLAGEDAGGVFTFAFTTFGQHMFMAAYFGIRRSRSRIPGRNIPSAIIWDYASSPAGSRSLWALATSLSADTPLRRRLSSS